MALCAVLLWFAIKHCPSSASSVTGFWGGASAGVGARQLPGSASRFGSAAISLIRVASPRFRSCKRYAEKNATYSDFKNELTRR